MWRWFVGRMMKREADRTIRSAKRLPFGIQKAIARHVCEKMAYVDQQTKTSGWEAGFVTLQAIGAEAKQDRHAALAQGATSAMDTAWNAASLVESWTLARMAMLRGGVSAKSFEYIDAALWEFITSTLEAAEMVGLIEGK
ncbi:MAG: hypothetical protein GY927_11720 [bacterium]|nr:hypothetical protein [bacterium]